MGRGNNIESDLVNKSLICDEEINDFSHYIDTDGCLFRMDKFLKHILKDDFDKTSDEIKIHILNQISNYINQNENVYCDFISKQLFNIQSNIDEIKFETTLHKELYFVGKRNYKYLQIKQ